MSEFLPMSEAPRDGTVIRLRTQGGVEFLAYWVDGRHMDTDENEVGTWVAAEGENYPSCWTDGERWASNIDGSPSDPPVGWKPN